MRLICGLFQLNGAAASKDLLWTMAAQMDQPRLCPQLTVWSEGPVALGTLDFTSGKDGATALPQDNGRILAADIRLDEPDALAAMLGRSAGEREDGLLLAALQQRGADGLDRVLGDFAFAVWDKNVERLALGRDVFGIRPLVYAHVPGELFAFASLPKALHGAGIVAKQVDEDAVAARVARMFRHDDTLFAGIKRLPPAHVIEISAGEVVLRRYWQFDRKAVGRRQCSAEEAAREMRRLVAEAVRCRLPRSGKIGAQLSGGLDSSAVSVLAARELRKQGRRLRAYSFLDRPRNDINLVDESAFIHAVVEQEGDIDWTPVYRSAASWSDADAIDADTMRPLPDQPHDFHVLAEAEGISLVLSGWGGDEGASFNGRGALAELFLHGRWRILAHEISALASRRRRPRLKIFQNEVCSYLWSSFASSAMLRLARHAIGKEGAVETPFGRALSRVARRRLASGDAPLRLIADACENRWRLLTSPHIAERAEKEAQLAARHGLAFAFPLLDRRVVEFALSLPSELFVRDGLRRRPFREAMADLLPAKLREEDRKLAPFPSLVIDAVAYREEFLGRLDRYENSEVIRRTLDLDWLRRQIAAYPSPDEVREDLRAGKQPATRSIIGIATAGVAAAAYLDQHAGK